MSNSDLTTVELSRRMCERMHWCISLGYRLTAQQRRRDVITAMTSLHHQQIGYCLQQCSLETGSQLNRGVHICNADATRRDGWVASASKVWTGYNYLLKGTWK